MTVIIGYVDKEKNRTIVGSDSCLSNGVRKSIINQEEGKLFSPRENDNFVVGVAGDPRLKQLIEAFINFPEENYIHKEQMPIDTNFMVRNFIPSLQKVINDNNYHDSNLNNSTILIAYKDKVWHLGFGFQLGIFESEFVTIGSGAEHAIAALKAYSESNMSILEKVAKALSISSEISIGVSGPNNIFITGQGKLNSKFVEKVCNNKRKTIQTLSNKFIKKIYKNSTLIKKNIEDNKLDFYFIKEDDQENIYFFSKNFMYINLFKSNGDIILNFTPNSLLANELDDYKMVELNKKATDIIRSLSDNQV